MIISIMQPTYYPWMGYFDMICQSDKFVFLDDVQLARRSWQVRNRIKFQDSELFLSIPVRKNKSRDETSIHEAEIDYAENWQGKHLKTLEHAYKKAAHYNEVIEEIQAIYDKKIPTLGGFNINIITRFCSRLGIDTQFVLSSEIPGVAGDKDERLADICLKLGADSYISPQGSANYIEKLSPGGEIVNQGIELYYHDYAHPVYPQLGKTFLPYIAIVDLLFNCGFDQSKAVIESGRKPLIPYKNFTQDERH